MTTRELNNRTSNYLKIPFTSLFTLRYMYVTLSTQRSEKILRLTGGEVKRKNRQSNIHVNCRANHVFAWHYQCIHVRDCVTSSSSDELVVLVGALQHLRGTSSRVEGLGPRTASWFDGSQKYCPTSQSWSQLNLKTLWERTTEMTLTICFVEQRNKTLATG